MFYINNISKSLLRFFGATSLDSSCSLVMYLINVVAFYIFFQVFNANYFLPLETTCSKVVINQKHRPRKSSSRFAACLTILNISKEIVVVA